MKMKMTYEAILVAVSFITCVSCGRSLGNKTAYNATDEDDEMERHLNTTEMSSNQNNSIDTTTKNNVLETVDTVETSYWSFRDGNVNYNFHIGNNSVIFKDKSEQVGNISNNINGINFDQDNLNISNNNDNIDSIHGDISLDSRMVLRNVSLHGKHKISHSTKCEDAKRLNLEKKKVILQHHLQLVPMEDKPLDSMVFKSQRYLISVLVPIGVGMIGAVMIACTVVTLRRVARKRPVHIPLDDDAETERSIASHISSISSDTTDKMFLLHTDEY